MNFIWGRLGEAVSLAVDNRPYDSLHGWELTIVDILIDRKTKLVGWKIVDKFGVLSGFQYQHEKQPDYYDLIKLNRECPRLAPFSVKEVFTND